MMDRSLSAYAVAALAGLPESHQAPATAALVAFATRMYEMADAHARGVSVAPYWRDPVVALRREAARLEGLAEVSAVMFTAMADWITDQAEDVASAG